MRVFKLSTLLNLFFVLGLAVNVQANHDPNPKELIAKVSVAMGGWNKLYDLHDVQFDYLYEYQGADKKDISKERYIFEGEHSWAEYKVHQINVLPEAGGTVVQSVVNNQAYISHNGKEVTNPEAVGGTMFLRKANYYWFTMMYKLEDPGTLVSYVGKEKVGDINYEKVALTYDSQKVGKEVNDSYILYINTKTGMVDQFYFSLPAMGVNKPVILMKVEYKEMKGVKLPVKRLIYQPNEKGEYSDSPNLIQTSENIQFNNGFKPSDFMLN